jgi:hypothetical protein
MGQWTIENEYYMSHPSGWTIAKYNVNESPVYMLWQGDTPRGKRGSVREAMSLHTQLVGAEAAPTQAAAPVASNSPADSSSVDATGQPSTKSRNLS